MDPSSGDVKIDVRPITEPQPAIPPIQPTQTEDPQTEATNNHHGGAPAQLPADSDNLDKQNAQRGENYGDSSGKLWTMYLNETEKEDKEITENWKVDTEGILVFTGLFSATVASFIIESYKQLSPDSSVTTNTLLTQISQQLANTSDGTPLAGVIAQPFKPTASACQGQRDVQWARRYLQLAQHRGAPHKRARLRAYIFDGIQGFGMTRAIEAMPALLHLSVFLFFAGLVDFLIPINTTVAYFTLGWIALFAAAYAILTILPNLRLNCPYRTPLSGITWRLSQFSVLGIFLAVLRIEGPFHEPLLSLWHWARRKMTKDSGPTKWRETLEEQVTMRRTWLKDGLRKSVELSATDAPPAVDKGALEWTLTALDEDKEFEDFAEHLPGFFDSKAVPNPTSAILPLMADQPTTDPILGSRLRDLLKTCIPGTSPLTEDKRRRRLRVCLKSLWYCGRAYNQLETPEPLPHYVRIVFADPEMTHRIQAEEDLAARVIGRCFGALVAKKLSSDIDSRDIPGVRVKEGELACLSSILGTDSHKVVPLLDQPGAIELASAISLISSNADSLVGETMPSDVLDVFKQTLCILLSETPRVEYLADLLRLQLAQLSNIYSQAPNWLKDELQQIWDRLPTGVVAFPEPQPAQEPLTHVSDVSQQPRENPGRIEGAR
ncbi:hypothetical protein EDB85DRAFT_2198679 [Lactarius pseudohatsudake]|nr:hypothetical protein EDB85DRAFT_2198679 [Lactarius pseudohatsudake]